ncbi:hypothetical protein [Arthrobacter sp. TB 23]|uniref:hypothetical protein n=1 Tax=Arthrobacter sp. TB 23 TaxID=494419 RepID=UPI0012E9F2B2|nr:hypothetical protein [Arthrobacter sp. TB 23]
MPKPENKLLWIVTPLSEFLFGCGIASLMIDLLVAAYLEVSGSTLSCRRSGVGGYGGGDHGGERVGSEADARLQTHHDPLGSEDGLCGSLHPSGR